MPRSLAEAALLELERREKAKQPTFDVSFPEQDAFVKDPEQFIAALCTRRAGKTNGVAFKLINKGKKYPGSHIPYIALTRDSAHNIIWPVFEQINQTYDLNLDMVESDLLIRLPNGSQIKLYGADQKNFIPRLLGGKYPICAVDEAQSFRGHLQSLIDDVLTAATGDYLDGQIVLCGTPGPVPKGYFYETTQGLHGFKVHKWTLYQNPYFPRPREFVQSLFDKKKWTLETPTYRRDYLGEWVADADALVYKFDPLKNTFRTLPDEEWTYVLGVDLGYSPDPSAFVLSAYNEYDGKLYVLLAETFPEMDVSSVAERVKYYLKSYPQALVVMDLGAQGKMIGEEIRKRHDIPIIAAEKAGKESFIEIVNSDLKAGNIKLSEGSCEPLVDEMMNLIWDTEKERRVEDSRYPNHCCDALNYSVRYCYSYIQNVKPEVVKRGSEREADIYWQQREEQLKRQGTDDDAWIG